MGVFNILFSQITMKDVFDIAVVSLMVYQVLKIVHGTRAVQMLFGMIFLALLYAIGFNYKLYTLNWILEHFFDYFFIIFIILFQDQLRSALANFGFSKTSFSFFGKKSEAFDLEEIIHATFKLASERIGALIVIEGKNGLGNYIETGTRLDSKLHGDLLHSIFLTKSPLHDGAVIIRKNEIASAGCFLPLSKNVVVDRGYGTRHRAAIGISEVSDAAVVVVSEETGRVSFCMDGVFYPCDSNTSLRKFLKSLNIENKLNKEKLSEV
jgi:diadenylate cyclase